MLNICYAGPDSPGWITIKEHGVQQSFDLTRIMFSRGNVSEKHRFGRELVQHHEIILDMYAGIGYYTLPAIIHGRARHVFACEWNPYAIYALRFNIRDNKISKDKVTILEGDCRVLCKEKGIIDMVDRVSLGLLPSSEGGWSTAVRALRHDRGGWLHIHGNVPTKEREGWAQWLCRRLLDFKAKQACANVTTASSSLSPPCWISVCTNIKKVKSFAPRIDHLVADVYLGPRDMLPVRTSNDSVTPGKFFQSGVYRQEDEIIMPCPNDLRPPSCALNSDGILNQKWLKDFDT